MSMYHRSTASCWWGSYWLFIRWPTVLVFTICKIKWGWWAQLFSFSRLLLVQIAMTLLKHGTRGNIIQGRKFASFKIFFCRFPMDLAKFHNNMRSRYFPSSKQLQWFDQISAQYFIKYLFHIWYLVFGIHEPPLWNAIPIIKFQRQSTRQSIIQGQNKESFSLSTIFYSII